MRLLRFSKVGYLTVFWGISIAFTFFYMRENKHLLAKLNQEKDNKIKSEEKFKGSFYRDLEIFSSLDDIYIPQYRLMEANECNSYLLIYVYGGDECEKCILEDIGELRDLGANLYPDNILVIPVFSGSLDSQIRLNHELDGLNFFRLENSEVKLPHFEGKSVRFFAVLNPEGNLTNLFFPDIHLPKKTRYYLDFIESSYF